MKNFTYIFEPPYHLYKEHQLLEQKIAEGCDDEEVIHRKEKLYKILLKEAPHYLNDASPYL